MKTKFRAHPLMILSFLKPLIFVAVLPLVRAVIQYLIMGSISGLLVLESITLIGIVLVATARWRSVSVEVDGDRLTVRRGFLIKRTDIIATDRLSSVSFKENPIDRLSRAVTLRINTEAGRVGRPDFEIKLYARDALALINRVYGDEGRTAICVSPVKIAAMAATTSSAVTGLIIGVPILNQAASLFGVALSERLYGELTALPERINTYFPSVVRTVTLVLMAGYAVAAGILFFKNLFFRIFIGADRLEVRSGVIVRRRTVFTRGSVNNVLIEQTPLMRIFRRFSMSVSVGGYGDERGERAIISPCGKRGEMRRQFMLFFPFLRADGTLIKPPRGVRNKQRFFFVPAVFSALVMAACVAAALIFPLFHQLILFLAVVAAAVICYYAGLCMYNYRFGRIRFGDNISARSSKGFNVRELYCEKGRVGEIKLIRYPADRRYGTCKVRLIIRSEGADSVRVRNVDFNDTKAAVFSCFSE